MLEMLKNETFDKVIRTHEDVAQAQIMTLADEVHALSSKNLAVGDRLKRLAKLVDDLNIAVKTLVIVNSIDEVLLREYTAPVTQPG